MPTSALWAVAAELWPVPGAPMVSWLEPSHGAWMAESQACPKAFLAEVALGPDLRPGVLALPS